jgi:hypothetical protein
MSMLSDFLSTHGIKPEDLITASAALETLDVDGRALQVKRAAARRDKKPYAELKLEKAKGLGRGLSVGTLQRALDGQPVPRLVRHKITRAVNARLASLKKDAVDHRPLFKDAKPKLGKTKKK